MAKVTLKVAGMTCAHCQKRIENNVGKLYGVQSVKADLATGEVRVVYDPAKTDPGAMRETIENVGYTVIA